MATTQNQNPTWMMNRLWQVVVAIPMNNSLSDSIVMTDTLKLTSLGAIEFTHNFPQGTSTSSSIQSSPQTWGTWSLSQDPNRLIGQTSAGVPFYIDYSVDQGVDRLTCYLATSQRPRRRWDVVWAVLGGTLAGVAVGVAARAPFVGFLAGFVAAGTSAAVASQGADSVQGGPNATWVANDGGSGVPQHRPHEVPQEVPHEVPRTLKAVSA
jgi:hypothetical protein